MKQLVSIKVASAVIAALGLSVGAVGVVGAATGTLGDTGVDSTNHVDAHDDTTVNGVNKTKLSATNNNPQQAHSGDATVEDNDEGGAAESGTAGNTSKVNAQVTVTHPGDDDDAPAVGGASTGTINGTGTGSTNSVSATSSYTQNQTNKTSVKVENNNAQTATTGNASVNNNSVGGNATSGAASNASDSAFTFNVSY